MEGWNFAHIALFSGLPFGIPFVLGIGLKTAEMLTGLPITTWVDAWTSNPVVENLEPVMNEAYGAIGTVMQNIFAFLASLDFTDPDFDVEVAAEAFVNLILLPTNLLPGLVSGLLSAANIPGLDASKIISGAFPISMITNLATLVAGFGTGSSIISQIISTIPNTTGSLTGLAGLTAAQADLFQLLGSPTAIGSGSPVLPGIGSIPLLGGLLSGGSLLGSLIPPLDASKIGSGTFANTFVPGVGLLQDAIWQTISGLSGTNAQIADIQSVLAAIPGLNILGYGGPTNIWESVQSTWDQFIGGFTDVIDASGATLPDTWNVANLIGSQSWLGKLAYDITGIRNNNSMSSGLLATSTSTVNHEAVVAGTSANVVAVGNTNAHTVWAREKENRSIGGVRWYGHGTVGLTDFKVAVWRVNPDNSYECLYLSSDIKATLDTSGTAANPPVQYHAFGGGAFGTAPVAVTAGDMIGVELIPAGANHSVAKVDTWAPLDPHVVPRRRCTTRSWANIPALELRGPQDAFDELDLTTIWETNGAPTLNSGRLEITNNGTYVDGRDAFDITSGWAQVIVEVPQVQSGAGATEFKLYSTSDTSDSVRIYHIGGNLFFDYQNNGVINQTSVAYNSTNHRWWRFRRSNVADIVFETSTDSNAWTAQRTVTPAWSAQFSSMKPRMFCGGGGSGNAQFDNFNKPQATAFVTSTVLPFIELAVDFGTGTTYHSPSTVQINTPGPYSQVVPDYVNTVKIRCLGAAGGAAAGAGNAFGSERGRGGNAGAYSAEVILTRGVDFSGTGATITGTIGAGGSGETGASGNNAANGGDTTATLGGTTVTGTGGAATNANATSTADRYGRSPGNSTIDGTSITGGGPQTTLGATGVAPGGGGGGGGALQSGGNGGTGSAWFRFIQ
jgi:hypothetical protein